MSVELVIDSKSTLGEGPSWDDKRNLLYWVDILQKKFYMYNPITQMNKEVMIDQYVGAVAPRNEGGVILALQHGFYFYDWETETIEKIDDPESHIAGNRFNDGKCDPAGRFWAGTMGVDESKSKGSLYVLDTDLQVHKKAEHISISNGLAWSPDFTYMYYIDTPTKQVVCYDYDVMTGNIENPNVALTFPEGAGWPDGMTIDEEGMLWIAHWGGSGISRWDPVKGKQLDFISIPAVNVTSCVFGGKDLQDLYITTARIATSEEDLEAFPSAGGVFKIKTIVKGSRSYPFNG